MKRLSTHIMLGSYLYDKTKLDPIIYYPLTELGNCSSFTLHSGPSISPTIKVDLYQGSPDQLVRRLRPTEIVRIRALVLLLIISLIHSLSKISFF
jgi:hypothetical protein